MELTGSNIILDTVKPQDVPTITAWSLKTRDSYFLLSSILPVSGDDLLLELQQTDRQIFVIKDRKDQALGLIKVYNINSANSRAMLSLTVLPSGNNTKLLQEAAELVLERLFKKQNIRKIYVNCLPTETEYKKILTALQFKKSGTYHEHLFLNDKFWDVEIFTLDQEDYYR